MSHQKRKHSAKFKTQVAISALKEELTQSQLTSHYGVHMTQVRRWKSQALESIESGFSKKRERAAQDTTELLSNLYEQIGRLQMELDWVKKKSGIDY